MKVSQIDRTAGFRLGMGLVCTSLLASCGSPALPASAEANGAGSGAASIAASGRPAGSAQPAKQTVILATPGGISLDYVAYAIAAQKGLYAKQGLGVKMVQMKSDAEVAGLSAGQVQYGVNLSPLVRAAANGGLPIRLLMAVSNPNYAFMIQPSLKSVSDLKGKTIGVTTKNGNFELAAKAVLAHGGLSRSDVKFTYLANAQAIFAALQQKLIDAGIVDSIVALKAEQAGLRKVSTTAPFYNGALDGLATSAPNLTQHPGQVEAMIRATLQGVQYMRQQPTETTAFIAKYLSQPAATSSALYQQAIAGLSRKGEISPTWLNGALAVSGQPPSARANFASLIDAGPLHRARGPS